MVEEQKQNRLGRGLSALLGETDLDAPEEAQAPSSGVTKLPIEFLERNPDQPRKTFNEEDLNDLSRSIREKGIVQPIIVRPLKDDADKYQIVAGERRWRAAQQAALHEVPVIIRDFSDLETLEIALIENIQRADLNPIEEAMGYQALMDHFDYTQNQLGEEIGKSRSHVANMLRLLTLSPKVQQYIVEGELSFGHGRALLGAEDPDLVAEQVIKEGLNVRQTEALAKGKVEKAPKPSKPGHTVSSEKDADTIALEQNVSNMLGLKVAIEHQGEEGGYVRIDYKTLEQLDEICRRLSNS